MHYTLKLATEADFDFLYNLSKITMKHYVIQTWGQWDEDFQAAFFRGYFEPAKNQLVLVENQRAGVIVIERRPDELHLAEIQLLPQYQGHGLGTALITALVDEGQRKSLPISLQVLKVNPAKELYKRLGFTVCGETNTHYLMRHN